MNLNLFNVKVEKINNPCFIMSQEIKNQGESREITGTDKFNRLFGKFENPAVKKIYENLTDGVKEKVMQLADQIITSDKAAAIFLNTKTNAGGGNSESNIDLVTNFILSEEAKKYLRKIIYENRDPQEVKITFFDTDEDDVVLPMEVSSTIPEGQIASDPRKTLCAFVLALRRDLRNQLEEEIKKDPSNIFHIMRALCAATDNQAYGDVIFSPAELAKDSSPTNFVIEREKLT